MEKIQLNGRSGGRKIKIGFDMKRSLIITLAVLFLFPSFSFGARRALLIGINDYKNLPSYSKDGISDLRGPANDVRIIKNVLTSSYGFSEGEIKTLINSEATGENIKKAFENWLVSGTSPGDLVIFFYSGHGAQIPDQNGDEADGKDEVLAPYDVVPEGGRNIIRDDELGTWLRKLSKREVVVFIDACHSGTMTRGIRDGGVSDLEPTPASKARFIPITYYEPQHLPRALPIQRDEPEDQIFMAASGEHEISLEIAFPDGFYGGFTHTLVEGLRERIGKTYEELYRYVKKEMKDRHRLGQTPQIEPSGGKKLAQVIFTTHAPSQETIVQAQPSPQKPTKPETPATTTKPPVLPKPPEPPPQIVKPETPAEIKGEKLLVAVEKFKGASPDAVKRLRQGLMRLSYIELVEENQFFDRIIRGEVAGGRYQGRILNRIGDIIRVPSTKSIDELLSVLAPRLESAYIVKQLTRIHHPNPPFRVSIESLYWDEREKKAEDEYRDFRIGDKVLFKVHVEKPGYIYILNADSEGNSHLLFPNQHHQNNYIEEGEKEIEIPDEVMRKDKFEFQFFPPAGEETVKVIATTEKLNIEALNIREFQEGFKIIPGDAKSEASPARNLARDLLKNISAGRFEWSEDTVVIRSHE